MLDRTDFVKKQIVFLLTSNGEKISYRNDNLIVKTKEGKIKYQTTCYRIFAIFIVGEVSITSGLIQRAKKFGFTILLMTRTFKLYSVIGTRMEGNTLLHRKQYAYAADQLAKFIVYNKIANQRAALNMIRYKNDCCKEAIQILDQYKQNILIQDTNQQSLLGIEGSAARVYFPQIFNNTKWKGRRPRTKCDFINTTLDIGYNLLFNMVDALLQIYGFDTYCGVYHKEFYMRKSLTCDLMEPMRPLIDLTVRKAINLKQFKEDDFGVYYNNQYSLSYNKSAKYIEIFMETLMDNKEEMFLFIQNYYRNFMKDNDISAYQLFEVK